MLFSTLLRYASEIGNKKEPFRKECFISKQTRELLFVTLCNETQHIFKKSKSEITFFTKSALIKVRSFRICEVGYEISTCQMQYDAADKKTDQEDPCFIYLGGN